MTTDPKAIQPSELDQLPDRDPEETAEWQASLDAVTKAAGPHRAAYLMRRTLERAEGAGLALPKLLETDYVNSIPTADEPTVDGDEAMEQRITAWNRWNAAAMVTRGSKYGVGGHIATFASAAWLYETGFNHFFKGKEGDGSGDQLYVQGHASPGIYARAFLDGRLSEEQLDNFRREAGGNGLPSYPHPRRLPWLWEFPTVSMGLGPISAIYQARFNRYLTSRGIKDLTNSHVWAFLGDGEMDEPESTTALTLASREGLDNLTFVINCNLQRLDGPVRANFKIVQELEAQFRGAGWNVVKSLWGTAWDELFQLDTTGALVRRLREVPDAQVQTYQTRDAAYIREDFFGKDPALVEMAKLLSDDKILECFHYSRGGHESRKVYAAYRAALAHKGAPTVILAQTVKGHTLGTGFASKNANHQMKKLSVDEFKDMRDLLGLPIKDSDFVDGVVPYGHPGADSPEVRYLQERRAALGGPAPARRVHPIAPLPAPADKAFASFDKGSGSQNVATTMAFVRLVKDLVRAKETGKRWVPIVPDEARTFGMERLSRPWASTRPSARRTRRSTATSWMYHRGAENGELNEGDAAGGVGGRRAHAAQGAGAGGGGTGAGDTAGALRAGCAAVGGVVRGLSTGACGACAGSVGVRGACGACAGSVGVRGACGACAGWWGCGVPAAPVRVRWGVPAAAVRCGFGLGVPAAPVRWGGLRRLCGFGGGARCAVRCGWVGAAPGGVRPRNGAESVGHRSPPARTRQPLRADTPRHDPFSPYAAAARRRRAAPARRTRLSRRVATPPRLRAVVRRPRCGPWSSPSLRAVAMPLSCGQSCCWGDGESGRSGTP
ncbi:hypothetical protein SVIOM342S_09013 [Streptomyces violaceorubidus]